MFYLLSFGFGESLLENFGECRHRKTYRTVSFWKDTGPKFLDEFRWMMILSKYPSIKGQEGQSFGFGERLLGKLGNAIIETYNLQN